MKILKWTGIVLLVAILTAISQVGGMVYLLSRLAYPRINKQVSGNWRRFALKFGVFAGLYIFTTFCIIPFIAKPFRRVPLPVVTKNNVKPLTVITCLLNRHYVTPALRQATFEVAGKMKAKYPGTTVCYMDACFPFINRFPLFPHLSHNDGKKLDIAFCYKDTKTGKPANRAPSRFGYGSCEVPLPGEPDMPGQCAQKGYWQYGLLCRIFLKGNRERYVFDPERTRTLV